VMTEETKRFWGKFRGTVINNVDPMQKGRLLVQVPDVLGMAFSTWAMPCFPFGGVQAGMFVAPPICSGVWIEFEGGDPDYPIWVGSYVGSAAETPAMAMLPAPPGGQSLVVQTTFQNTLMVSDIPGPTGGIVLKTKTGASILMNETGITISNGLGAMISLIGNTVAINGTALTVT
jgi:uncharacterized protein involved in type VI secretion and phage assembly